MVDAGRHSGRIRADFNPITGADHRRFAAGAKRCSIRRIKRWGADVTVLVILALLFALLLSGIPVAFALGGLGALLLAYAGFSEQMAPAALLSSMDSFVLIAVPLFLLMSNIMLKGGVGKDLFEAVQAWVGHLPGGLAVATVLSCGIFAAISGSSVATAATIGTVAIPEMTERGYQRSFVFGLAGCRGHAGHFDPRRL